MNEPVQQKPKKKNIPKLPGVIRYNTLKEAIEGVKKEMEALHSINAKSGVA